jgi:hypothetical protein
MRAHVITMNKWVFKIFVIYFKALSIFRYIKNNNKNWKNEGIYDGDLEYIEAY